MKNVRITLTTLNNIANSFKFISTIALIFTTRTNKQKIYVIRPDVSEQLNVKYD